nr:MAG TPA: hypothetical protein [Caudoviricetes sp.]
MVIKETHNKQAVSRKYNKSSSDRTLENIPIRRCRLTDGISCMVQIHAISIQLYFFTHKRHGISRGFRFFAMMWGVQI